ncbi:MAG: biopolymer transporter Tol [Chthoniobacteraceae bacterium]
MLRKISLAAAGCLAAFSLAALAPALISTTALAAETPTITISKNGSVAIAIGPISGPDGAQIAKIVQSDLALSGFFSFTDPASAPMVINGSSSGSLEGKVVERSGGNVLMRSYDGDTASKAHAFANDIIQTLTGSRGMAGSKIAFISGHGSKKELYLANYDGSNARQLTQDSTISAAPSISPDGSKIAYTSYLKGYADIYLINLASGARERIVKFPGTNSGAAFSPDGNRIALTCSRDGNPELYVVDPNGGSARRLTHTRGVESSPTWSPDGGEIIYSSDDGGSPQLYRISAGGGSGHRLSTGYGYCTKPSWSPDGKRVAFNVREGGSFQVAVLELSGGSVRLVSGGGEARDPVWGPDSRHLLFTQDGSLIMLDTQTSRRSSVMGGAGSASEPSWTR